MKADEPAGLEIELGFYPWQLPWSLAAAIARSSICLSIDGSRPRFMPTGVHLFTLAPGTHVVRGFCQNLLLKDASEAAYTMEVKAGTVVRLRYRPHPMLLARPGTWQPRHWRPFVAQDAHAHPAAAPGWFPDPTGRHELRYHDEWRWTDQVSDGGIPGVQALPSPVTVRRRGKVRLVFQAMAGALALWAGSSLVASEARQAKDEREQAAFLASPTVLDVAADVVDARNEGRLVRVVGKAQSYGRATDRDLGVEVVALALERTVEERQAQARGRRWSAEPAAAPGGPVKPGRRTFLSDWWHVGAFTMPHDTVAPNAGELQEVPAGRWMLQSLAPAYHERARFDDGLLYLGNPAAPRVGDVRVTYRYLPETKVTVIGRQEGKSLVPYRMRPGGEELWLLQAGEAPASAVRVRHVREHMGWISLGWISLGWILALPLLLVGVLLSYRPLAALADGTRRSQRQV